MPHMKHTRVFLVTLSLLLLLSFLIACSSSQSRIPGASEDDSFRPLTASAPTVSTLVVCGDAMSHMPITRAAWDASREVYDYRPIFAGAAPPARAADYAVANLETTFAGGPDYSGFPTFNSPDEMADGLKDAGFDLLLTANNHCMDQGFSGLCRTLDVLDEKGIAHVGTSRTEEEQKKNVVVADVGGISVAFLGFTYGTNGIPLAADAPFSVNLFNKDYNTTEKTPDEARMIAALDAAKALRPDLIAVMIHWGVEYQTTQNAYQESIADFLFDHGADIILGGHSHVLQPMMLRSIRRDAEEKQGFVCYSLGNFTSSQKDPLTDTTVLLELTLTRDNESGLCEVADFNYRPMLMSRQDASPRYRLVDAYQTIAEKEGTSLAEQCRRAISDCHKILGAEHDPQAAEAPVTEEAN